MCDKKRRIALTGGSGFLGSHLLSHEAFREALVIGRTRPPNHNYYEAVHFDAVDIPVNVLRDYEVVVHAAARAHVMYETASSPLNEYRRINTIGTLNFAKQAALAGVKRFIFISTIKVLGEETQIGKPFTNKSDLDPKDPYSLSKAEAEVGLRTIGNNFGMDIVIIRPPLIYGAGVKGNFLSLLKLVRLPIPLPLGAIKNKRSLISVGNLVDLVVTCIDHPNARNETFLASDDSDFSTPDLLSMMASVGGRKSWMFKCPNFFLYSLLRFFGKLAIYERLSGSMQVDINHTKSQLSWKPPFNVEDSLASCWLPND